MKKSTISAIAAVSVAGLFAVGLGAVSDWYKNWNVKSWFNYWGKGAPTVEQPQDADTESGLGLTVTPNASEVMRLFVGRSSALSETAVTVTAVLTPANDDLLLDWSIENLDGSPTSAVTVTPSSDGAKTATVECLSAFEDELILKVTVRNVGSFATASVKFIGKPTSLTTTSSDLTQSGDTYLAGGVADYTVNLVLSNKFNSVGDSFGDFEITNIAYSGTVKLKHVVYNSKGSPGSPTYQNVDFADLASNYFDFSISGDVLNVTCNGTVADYAIISDVATFAVVNPLANKHEYTFSSIVETCVCNVTVQDKVSGLSTVVNVGWTDTMLTVVSLDKSEITF